MKFYVQHGDDIPLALPIKEFNKAQLLANKPFIDIGGKTFKVLGIHEDDWFSDFDGLWEKKDIKKGDIKKEVQRSSYDRLKKNVEHLRERGSWPEK